MSPFKAWYTIQERLFLLELIPYDLCFDMSIKFKFIVQIFSPRTDQSV